MSDANMWASEVIPAAKVTLEADQTYLRPVCEVSPDAYLPFLVRNREHISKYMPDEILAMSTASEIGAWQGAMADEWREGLSLCFVGVHRDTGEIVSQIYVSALDQAAAIVEIGYFGDVQTAGRGFVTEAVRAVCAFLFERVGVFKVAAICDGEHLASARVAQRSGFQEEGLLRQHALNKDGTRPDRRVFGLLRSDKM